MQRTPNFSISCGLKGLSVTQAKGDVILSIIVN